jgi:hypothetical protein
MTPLFHASQYCPYHLRNPPEEGCHIRNKEEATVMIDSNLLAKNKRKQNSAHDKFLLPGVLEEQTNDDSCKSDELSRYFLFYRSILLHITILESPEDDQCWSKHLVCI